MGYRTPQLIERNAPLKRPPLPTHLMEGSDIADGARENRATTSCERTLQPGSIGILDLVTDRFQLNLGKSSATIPWGCELWNIPLNKGRDTPTAIRGFDNKNRLDSTMALRKLAQGGRPSKGPRHTFNVKPDITRAEKLRDILEILDCNAVDYLTPLVAAHIDSIDLEKFRAEHIQETLPIAKAS
ncbi:hypothetical protein J2Y41_003869 [Arthrobacter sp. 1088]|nr:hypothetical protein [Arthrobacter sp. 1088]